MWTKRLVALVWILAVGPRFAMAIDPSAGVTSAPPEINVAVMIDGQTVELRKFVVRYANRSALPPLLPANELVPVVEMASSRYDLTAIKAQRIDGGAVTNQVLAQALARPAPVLVQKRGEPLDPIFKLLFKPEILLITPPLQRPTGYLGTPSVKKSDE